MQDTDSQTSGSTVEPDGGVASQAEQTHTETDYLSREVNLLNPSTAFMRDHLKVVWATFVAWTLVVFGPVTLTWLAPATMTQPMPVIGFPLHYFLVALGGPTGALVLAAVYAHYRDRLDRKYGIVHAPADADRETGDATAADGGREP